MTDSPKLPRFLSFLQAASLSISLALAIPFSFGAGVLLGARDTTKVHQQSPLQPPAGVRQPRPVGPDEDLRVYLVSSEQKRDLLIDALNSQNRALQRPPVDPSTILVQGPGSEPENTEAIIELNSLRHGIGLPNVVVVDLRNR